ncbi:Nitrilotriacetate monooxygenase component A/pristinamycin IIA synthase subunit A [Penicillium digitatum]|uniref:Nitrilotriacetate monooxygenase component A/pristinamycin IIA synthase subunit A n=1 Tax=Penicillium digitatum TaxID=36651 RepID=A0A7T6XNP3_PENDI|nr:Nitrilotriacetate monooxygenase component A/pristinamycin IIA synthase subunit A [Penicillium digitatum]
MLSMCRPWDIYLLDNGRMPKTSLQPRERLDTTGGHDTYEGILGECIRRAAQWPVKDPTAPISAMAAVTQNLSFGITASNSFEQPFLVAKRFSALNHLTNGRMSWNIVTSYKKAAFKTTDMDIPIELDERTFAPIIGKTDEEARAKYEELKKYASVVEGLVLFSGWTGIDISKIALDQETTILGSLEANKVTGWLDSLLTTSKEIPRWTPRVIAERAAIGGLDPVAIGSPATVAEETERWIQEADLDGCNLAYVATPGTFKEVVDLLIPELKRRRV